MSHLFWNPLAITLLIETILTYLIAGFFIHQFKRALASKHNIRITLILLATFIGAAFAATCQLLSDVLDTDLASIPLAWVSAPGAVGMAGFVLFSYYFQKEPGGNRLIGILLILTLTLIIAAEVYVAIARVLLLQDGLVEYRDAWLDLPLALGFLLSYVFFFASLVRALAMAERINWPHALLPAVLAVLWPPMRLPQKAAASRAFFYVALMPFAMGLAALTRSYGLIDWRLAELLIGWFYLFTIASFTLVYLNYIPEYSSFRVKLIGVTLTTILVILCGVSWIIGPIYTDAYKADALPTTGTAIRYDPQPDGSYVLSRIPARFETELGRKLEKSERAIPLHVPFPYFGKTYDHLYPASGGMVGLKQIIVWRDIQHQLGPQPLISLLAAGLKETNASQSGLHIRQDQKTIILTWNKMISAFAASDHYTAQLKLYPTGRIEMIYANMPAKPHYDVYRVHAAPIFSGILPGWKDRRIKAVNMISDHSIRGAPGEGLISYHRKVFLTYLDRIYEPIALFILISSMLVLLIFPRFFTVNLDRPLQNLLGGVRQILQGRLKTSIPISHRDEIGYLAESFNEMAKAQDELIQTLEDKVTARTAEASRYAEQNARLEERNHLSQELHDAVSQTLFSANLMADTMPSVMKNSPEAAIETLQAVRSLNKNALVEMRNLLIELRSKKLTSHTLGHLMRELADDMQGRSTAPIHLEIEGDLPLPEHVQHTFFRIVQECLANAIKHAQAGAISIYFDSMASQAMVSVEDDGCGFERGNETGNSFGLQIMKERMIKIGGTLDVSSSPGNGTCVTAIWMDGNEE